MPRGIYKRQPRFCSIEGCGENHYAKDLCRKHYFRMHKYGSTETPQGSLRHREICSIVNCGREHKAHGFCERHMLSIWYKQNSETPENKCSVAGCPTRKYAKGFCRAHHANFLRCGNPLGSRINRLVNRKCSVSNCNKPAEKISKNKRAYCKFHHTRMLQKKCGHTKRKLSGPIGNNGSLNHNWKGGIADYPNHYKMKKIRREIIKERDGKCEICGNAGNEVHHKDGNKAHHEKENFILCCHKCHRGLHRGEKHTSKYTRRYGLTLTDLAAKFHVSMSTILRWQYNGRLDAVLNINIPTMVSEQAQDLLTGQTSCSLEASQ